MQVVLVDNQNEVLIFSFFIFLLLLLFFYPTPLILLSNYLVLNLIGI